MSRLRPHPHRGDVVAAGAVPLAVAAFVIELRMTQWSLGPRFVVVALIAVLLLTMGWLAELEGEAPRSYHTTLLLSGLLPLALALVLLAEVLGASRPPGNGGLAWTFAVEGLVAVACARRADSAVCTLIAALAGIVAIEAFVSWVFQPHGPGTFRAMLVAITFGSITGVVRLRDRHHRHAVQLANAAGLAVLLLGATFVVPAVLFGVFPGGGELGHPAAAFGWKLFLLAVGLGSLAYAGAEREPGPAYIGVAVLGEFVVLAGFGSAGAGSLVGWPLFLLIIGGALLAIGLRPRVPLPPPPGQPAPAPTVPLHSTEGP